MNTKTSPAINTPYSAIKDIELYDFARDKKVTANSLWKDSAALILVVRRPGCAICRNEALKLASHRELITEKMASIHGHLSGIKMIAIVQEQIDTEVQDFNDGFWKGDVFIDEEKRFYRALGGGELKWSGTTNFLRSSVWKKYLNGRKIVGGNFKGQGRILGGSYIVYPGSRGIAFEHREKFFGNFPAIDELITKCKAISSNNLDSNTDASIKKAITAANFCRYNPSEPGLCGGLNGMCPDYDSEDDE
ncbi:7202_t:CDS:2 [Ambispora gerdemannii]|uniref:Peroxiredoxin-like 2A n=1 Tax=Ambispora gerdemannii TaxID=144530 RepID=A0A9N9FTP4_9GLOM|nr:7202_t:CDS:2 [Ambispora gerdemannii]